MTAPDRAAATAPRPVPDQCLSRLRQHLAAIAEGDWDYFALLRFGPDAKQAVSDLERLARHIERLEASRG